MIRFRFFSLLISLMLIGALVSFSGCEDEMPEPEPPIEENDTLPNDVRFQVRGGSFGEENVVFNKTEGTISKTGYEESTGTTRLYTLSPRSNSNQNDIIDIYLPFTPSTGKSQVVLEDVSRQSKLRDFNIYITGARQVSLQRITIEIDEYGDVGGRIKGQFFGKGMDESIGEEVNINFGEFDMLRTY